MSFRDNLRKVTPYVPGEQPRGSVIKLNTNECPYPPSPKVAEALRNMDPERLRLYPEVGIETLTEALSAYYGVKKEQIFAGVGSDDVLSMCFLAFFEGKKPVLFPDVTYSFYDVWAEVYRIPYRTVPLDPDFRIRPEDYLAENGGIVIANPNAPTGRAEELSVLQEIIEKNQDSVVIIDEAYVDFGGETALPLIDRYPNLAVVRTMSKSRAMAGMRIGYAFASRELMEVLQAVKYSVNSYTMNTPSILAGAAAIKDESYFREITEKIIKTRERSRDVLCGLGFSCGRSSTNFLFAKPPEGIGAARVFEALKERRIYVRHFKKPERIADYLRITVGTEEEMDALFAALREILPALREEA
ncbi:MAG: histidinol-phosphate transaminase [Lachnospiraceae bacterium]|nr:histidinol-phosphate transaminase [Lachnospiraceae bacterium]